MPFGDRVRNKLSEKMAQQQPEPAPTAADAPVADAPVAAAPVAAAPAVDPMERLKDLGQLHEQGILTDEEFAAEKAKVLNG
jgi:hypothetical protein